MSCLKYLSHHLKASCVGSYHKDWAPAIAKTRWPTQHCRPNSFHGVLCHCSTWDIAAVTSQYRVTWGSISSKLIIGRLSFPSRALCSEWQEHFPWKDLSYSCTLEQPATAFRPAPGLTDFRSGFLFWLASAPLSPVTTKLATCCCFSLCMPKHRNRWIIHYWKDWGSTGWRSPLCLFCRVCLHRTLCYMYQNQDLLPFR